MIKFATWIISYVLEKKKKMEQIKMEINLNGKLYQKCV